MKSNPAERFKAPELSTFTVFGLSDTGEPVEYFTKAANCAEARERFLTRNPGAKVAAVSAGRIANLLVKP